MDAMPRPKLPFVTLEIARGKRFWYFRRGKGKRVRLRGDYGAPEFLAAYNAALAGLAVQRKHGLPPQGTLGWLIDAYQGSSVWDRLSKATKSQRANIYKAVIKRAGDSPLSAISQVVIERGREDRAKTPFAANDFLKAMKALFKWGKEARHVEIDPTAGVKGFPHKTEGFHAWTEEEISQFERSWPIGTRQRLALAILLFTGLRRGDAAMLGRQHIKDGVITFRTAKTGQLVTIPLLPELAKVIEATRTCDLAFVATPSGAPMTKEGFGNWFRKACKAAGVPGSAHGLRKASATRFANAGFTEAELDAWFGWKGGKMASYYTKEADRVRLARQAIGKLAK